MSDTSRPSMRDLVLMPALITLAVTALRLTGELLHWNRTFFSPAGGGGGAVVGISWLPIFFGIYFASRLVAAGDGPATAGRAIGRAVLGFLIVPVAIFIVAGVLKLGQTATIVTSCLAFVVAGWVASRGWPALGRVLLVYGLAARIPVALLMLPAIIGKWGTHYDALPPNFPVMSPFATWGLVGLFPQMTLWLGWTVAVGAITGGITAKVKAGKRREAVPSAA
jgi:hypothetical protein